MRRGWGDDGAATRGVHPSCLQLKSRIGVAFFWRCQERRSGCCGPHTRRIQSSLGIDS